MSRYRPERKGQTRQKVLEVAGRTLRKEGPTAATIPGIMGEAGLTQGAFYAHFASKEAMLAEASADALARAAQRLLSRGRTAPPGEEMAAIVEHYLSREHRDNLTDGCPLPTFAADAIRGAPGVRRAYTVGLAGLCAEFAALLPPSGNLPDRQLAVASAMVGGLLLSRAVDDADLSDRILAATRALCLRALGGDE